jgi:microcompartment protein CcmL/EutN
MKTPPAIAVLEFDSVAVGTRAADAMVKRAPIDTFRIGTVHPGKYLVLIGGSVAAVEESRVEGLRIGGDAVTDEIFLADVHPQVFAAVSGKRRANTGDALGIIETCAIPANVTAADKAVKAARITIVEIRLGDGLGGKGITHLAGAVHDVEVAIEAAIAAAERPGVSARHTIIPIQHAELRDRIGHATEFYA